MHMISDLKQCLYYKCAEIVLNPGTFVGLIAAGKVETEIVAEIKKATRLRGKVYIGPNIIKGTAAFSRLRIRVFYLFAFNTVKM